MEGFSSKKSKIKEIHINQIPSLKRVTDLFPKGLTGESGLRNLSADVTQIISKSTITKNIPNLAQTTKIIPTIPKNSLSSQVTKQNDTLVKVVQSQYQNTFIKRFKPFNIVTILLFTGWLITITLLTIF